MVSSYWDHYDYDMDDDDLKDLLHQQSEKEMKGYKIMKPYEFKLNREKKVYRIIAPEARGSYMQSILEPQGFNEGDAKEYNCQLRWPIDDDNVRKWAGEMFKMFQAILIDKLGEKKASNIIDPKTGKLVNPNFKIPLRNGNNEDNEELHGYLFMNVRNKFRQPVILGPHAKALPEELINEENIYSGAWYRARLNFSHYDNIGKGIGAYVEVLMKTRDDDRLDNVINVGAAEDEFSDFASEDAGFGVEDEVSAAKEDDDLAFL